MSYRRRRTGWLVLASPGGEILARVDTRRIPPRVEVHPYPTPAAQMEIAAWLVATVFPGRTHESVRQEFFGDWVPCEG